MADLFTELYMFIDKYLIHDGEIVDVLKKFFEGSLRLTMTVHNQFKDFMSHFYFDFVNMIPDTCL